MSACVLKQLMSEDFVLSLAFLSTPGPLRRALSRTQEVHAVREALVQGAITEDTIGRFVSDLTEDFHRGKQFLHEIPLAALAVAVETRATDFADEFLKDLSRLRLAEMGLCIRVARECLKRRGWLAANKHRSFHLSRAEDATPVSSGNLQGKGRKEPVEVTKQICQLEAV